MKKYSMERRDKIHALLGGVCVECGTSEDLQAHHRDPETKEFTLASGWHHAWDRLVVEAMKCELLCGDCHREHHRSEHPHGTTLRYWRGCRCDRCKLANTEYGRQKRLAKKAGRHGGEA